MVKIKDEELVEHFRELKEGIQSNHSSLEEVKKEQKAGADKLLETVGTLGTTITQSVESSGESLSRAVTEKMDSDLDGVQQAIHTVGSDVKDLKPPLTELGSLINENLKINLAKAVERIESTERTLTEVRNEVSNLLQGVNNDLNASLANFQTSLDRKNEQLVTELTTHLSQLRERIQGIADETTQLGKTLSDQGTTLNQQIAGLSDVLQKQAEDHTSQFQEHVSSEVGQLSSQVKETREGLAGLVEEKVTKLEQQVDSMRTDLSTKLETANDNYNENTEKIIWGVTRSVEEKQETLEKALSEEIEKVLWGITKAIEDRQTQLEEGLSEQSEKILWGVTDSIEKKQEPLIAEVSSIKGTVDTLPKKFEQLLGTLLTQVQDSIVEKLGEHIDARVGELTTNQNEFFEMSRSQYESMVQRTEDVVEATQNPPNIPDAYKRDVDEIRGLIEYLRKMPTDKEDVVAEIERVRDVTIFERKEEAPYRTTASKTFRELISEVRSEQKTISREKIRDVIKSLEQLVNYIHASA